MSIQRRPNIDATSWRCIDVETTLYKRRLPAGGELPWNGKQKKNTEGLELDDAKRDIFSLVAAK